MSPPNERSRPAGNGPANRSLNDDTTSLPPSSDKFLHFRPCARRAPTEFQRMRRPRAEYEAAGRRLRSLYGAKHGPVICRAIGTQSVEFTGATGSVIDVADQLGVRWMRSRSGDGVLVWQEDAADVMAAIEALLGQRVEVTL